ncbi:MAG: SAV_6107 family HEPN domain-containing protein [Actinomycetota bacterium]|nr:SAV_6107 family HEPN domain-containing protein [Actinomycetota bacterium]
MSTGRNATGVRPAPIPVATAQLLRRADAELLAARFTADADDRFVHAHLAALRAAAALVAAWGTPSKRRGPRAVWELLARTAPEFEGWTAYFASGAPERADIEAGVSGVVSDARAGEILATAEDFVDEVRIALEESSAARAAERGPGAKVG